MKEKRIKFRILPDGETILMEVIGAEGKVCEDLTRAFEQKFAGEIIDRQTKPEYDVVRS